MLRMAFIVIAILERRTSNPTSPVIGLIFEENNERVLSNNATTDISSCFGKTLGIGGYFTDMVIDSGKKRIILAF